MNLSSRQMFFALLRYEIAGTAVDCPPLADNELAALLRLSQKHDLAHLVGDALIKNRLIDSASPHWLEFEQQLNLSFFRGMNLEHELQGITQSLGEAQIPFVVLKGGRIRWLYPEPWMRTSCDIDVLVHEEDLRRAARVLEEKLRYRTDDRQHYHDLSLYSQSGVHLELHYSVLENISKMDRVLKTVWEHVTLQGGSQYEETPEFFLFHHIAHMLYHVCGGGCGVRPFIDLWLLENRLHYDEQKLNALLDRCEMRAFYQTCRRIARSWLEGDTPLAEEEERFASYVLFGGVYGNTSNRVSVRCVKESKKSRYLVSRAFLSYDSLTNIYPWLKGRKWLTPVAQACRWCRWLQGDKSRTASELKVVRRVDADEADNMRKTLNAIGLQPYYEKD